MRLKQVENGQSTFHRLKLWMIRLAVGAFPDVMRTMYYRPEFFGRHFLAAMQETMRGPSPWSPAERELFASFVSSKNQCPDQWASYVRLEALRQPLIPPTPFIPAIPRWLLAHENARRSA
ncbi:MAG: hypothetical protein ACREQ9_21550 [Candidatus Binatia bacterium]